MKEAVMIFSYHRLVNTCTAHAAIGSVISMAGKNEIPAHPTSHHFCIADFDPGANLQEVLHEG